MNFENFKFY